MKVGSVSSDTRHAWGVQEPRSFVSTPQTSRGGLQVVTSRFRENSLSQLF